MVVFPLTTVLSLCGPFGTGVVLRSPTATAGAGTETVFISAFGSAAAGAALTFSSFLASTFGASAAGFGASAAGFGASSSFLALLS